MDRRLALDQILREVLGSSNVYFQPPSNIQMKYPAIVYSRDQTNVKFADNDVYGQTKRYQVQVIDRDPDSEIPDKVGSLPRTSFAQHYVADGLNHDVYRLYF